MSPFGGNGLNDALVGHVPRGIQDTALFTHKRRKAFFKLEVKIQRAIQETAARATRAILFEWPASRLL